MNNRNRFWVAENRFQNFENFPRVLTVCSAGVLRSPTAAYVLSKDPFNYNTRACGLDLDFALIQFDEVLAVWAEKIVVMDFSQKRKVTELLQGWDLFGSKLVLNFEIPDDYDYRDPSLCQLIYNKALEFGLARDK